MSQEDDKVNTSPQVAVSTNETHQVNVQHLQKEEVENKNQCPLPKKRRKMMYTMEQLALLERVFIETKYPCKRKLEKISSILNMTVERIRNWFQNRRARQRRQLKKQRIMYEMMSGHTSLLKNASASTDHNELFCTAKPFKEDTSLERSRSPLEMNLIGTNKSAHLRSDSIETFSSVFQKPRMSTESEMLTKGAPSTVSKSPSKNHAHQKAYVKPFNSMERDRSLPNTKRMNDSDAREFQLPASDNLVLTSTPVKEKMPYPNGDLKTTAMMPLTVPALDPYQYSGSLSRMIRPQSFQYYQQPEMPRQHVPVEPQYGSQGHDLYQMILQYYAASGNNFNFMTPIPSYQFYQTSQLHMNSPLQTNVLNYNESYRFVPWSNWLLAYQQQSLLQNSKTIPEEGTQVDQTESRPTFPKTPTPNFNANGDNFAQTPTYCHSSENHDLNNRQYPISVTRYESSLSSINKLYGVPKVNVSHSLPADPHVSTCQAFQYFDYSTQHEVYSNHFHSTNIPKSSICSDQDWNCFKTAEPSESITLQSQNNSITDANNNSAPVKDDYHASISTEIVLDRTNQVTNLTEIKETPFKQIKVSGSDIPLDKKCTEYSRYNEMKSFVQNEANNSLIEYAKSSTVHDYSSDGTDYIHKKMSAVSPKNHKRIPQRKEPQLGTSIELNSGFLLKDEKNVYGKDQNSNEKDLLFSLYSQYNVKSILDSVPVVEKSGHSNSDVKQESSFATGSEVNLCKKPNMVFGEKSWVSGEKFACCNQDSNNNEIASHVSSERLKFIGSRAQTLNVDSKSFLPQQIDTSELWNQDPYMNDIESEEESSTSTETLSTSSCKYSDEDTDSAYSPQFDTVLK